MSKKSYKRNQNRLYREIKRRVIAEGMLKRPVFPGKMKPIAVLKVRSIVQDYLADNMEFVKQDMARRITDKLIADGYITFFSKGQDSELPINCCTEVEAKVYVVRPPEY